MFIAVVDFGKSHGFDFHTTINKNQMVSKNKAQVGIITNVIQLVVGRGI